MMFPTLFSICTLAASLVLFRKWRRSEESRQILSQLFHQAVVDKVDDYRKEIARELHDDLVQRVVVLRMSAGPKLECTQVDRGLGELAKSIRDLAHRLHACEDSSAPLSKALQELCRDASHLTGKVVTLSKDGDFERLDASTSRNLQRIAQEAVSNALQHGDATRIRIELARKGRLLELVVSDDGCGFDPDKIRPGLGLRSIQDRTASMGGRIELTSRPREGTTLRIRLEP